MDASPAIDFFISYTKADEAWAEWIAWQLQQDDYAVLLQVWDFDAGGNFVEEMHSAIERARRCIAVLSPDYPKSDFAAPEWQAVFSQDPRGRERKLVPVRVRACKPTGLLRNIVYIDLVGLGEDAARQRLLSRLKGGRPQHAPGFPGIQPSDSAPQLATPALEKPPFPKPSIEINVDCSPGECDGAGIADFLAGLTESSLELSGTQRDQHGRTNVAISADAAAVRQTLAALQANWELLEQLADEFSVRRISASRDDREHVIWIPDADERERRREWLDGVCQDVLDQLREIANSKAIERLASLVSLKIEQRQAPSGDPSGSQANQYDEDFLSELASRLVRQPDCINKFTRQVKPVLKGSPSDTERLEVIHDLLLPVWFGPHVRDRLYGAVTVEKLLLVHKAAATTCGLEIEMAVFDGRQVDFADPDAGDPEELAGSLLFRHVPARPKDPDIDETALEIIADLAHQHIPSDALPESEIVMEELETGRRKPRVTEELLPKYAAQLNAALEGYCSEKGTPYCAVRMPSSEVHCQPLFPGATLRG